MKIFLVLALLAVTAAVPPALAQDQSQQGQPSLQQEGQTPAQAEPAPPVKPPRIVGQPQTQEELDAWQAIEAATDLDVKAELARKFLATFPESGLTPYAHHLLARHTYTQGEIDDFVKHSEKALAELPDVLDLLSPLAFVYAEQGKSDKAISSAQKVTELMATVKVPEGVSSEEWVKQINQMKADAYYAIGRAHLAKFISTGANAENKAEHPELKQAAEFLQRAATTDPRHDYAYFRLGYAYTQMNDAGKALEAFARASALGGPAAGPSQEQAQRVHAFLKEHQSSSEWANKSLQEIISAEQNEVQQEVAQLQQQLLQDSQKLEEERQQQKQQQQQLLQPALTPPPATSPN